jgi:predicted DCC family thiol-disulfide oxidoreductase YuxK
VTDDREATERPTLLYDGNCGFCTRTVELALEVLPHRVTWRPYQEVEDLDSYGVGEDDAARAVQFVDPSGRVETGSAAVAKVLVASGGPWSLLGRAMLLPPVSVAAEIAYHVVAANRRRLPGTTPAMSRPPSQRPGAPA